MVARTLVGTEGEDSTSRTKHLEAGSSTANRPKENNWGCFAPKAVVDLWTAQALDLPDRPLIEGKNVRPRRENLNGKVRGALLPGAAHSKTGVLVLGGSSGRVDIPRAGLFAQAGAHALALQWFGGTGQSPGICEIPFETFIDATDLLTSRGCDRIIVVGTSKGAEAALLASTIDQRIKAVVAISPTSVVWGNIGEGVDRIAWPERSSWSLKVLH